MSSDNVVLARNTVDALKSEKQSQTVAFSHYNNFSAQLPIDPKTDELVIGGIKEQARQCLMNIKSIVDSIDHTMNDIVRMTIFVRDIKDIDTVNNIYKEFFPTYLPARTVLAVSELPLNALIQVEALLSNGEGTIPDEPQAGDLIKLTNNTCYAPLDDMSTQTVAFSHYNNLSAQLPINPKNGRIVEECIEAQTKQCLTNIKAILESIDVPMDDIVKTTIFVKNLSDIEAVDKAYKTFFPGSGIARAVNYLPARTVVEVTDLLMGASVQIEAVVSHGHGTPPQAIEDRHGLIIEANNTSKAAIDSLSTQTVAFSHYNNISAQLPVTSSGELVSSDISLQAEQCLENIKNIIECVDHTMEDIVKVNIFLKDVADIEKIEAIYKGFFSKDMPARRVVGVSSLPEGALIQMDAIAGNAEGTPPLV